MPEYEPHSGDRLRCIAEDGGVNMDEVGTVVTVIREPSIVLKGDNGRLYVVAIAAAKLERLGA